MSWKGITYHNEANSCPIAYETLKGHMVQVRQDIRSNNPKPQRITSKLPEATSLPSDTTPSHEKHVKVKHIRKLYTDDTGHFPIRSRSGDQYIMIAYDFYSNAIIAAPFKSRADKHILLA